MTTKSIASATAGQKKQLVRLIEEVGEGALAELGINKEDARRLLGKGGDFKSRLHRLLAPLVQELSVAPNIVVVPDLAAVELTALAKRDLKLTYLDADYAKWDYYRDVDGRPVAGRGQKFEALVYKPELGSNGAISSENARAYLRERGYIGHVAAFTQWRRQNPDLMGYHASIPEDAVCWRGADGLLGAPCSCFDAGGRGLVRCWVGRGWSGYWSFVGFREVS